MPINLVVARNAARADHAAAILAIDVEARDYFVRAADRLGVGGLGVLARLDPFDYAEFEGRELVGLSDALPAFRERLSTELSAQRESVPSELEPPARVGFLDVRGGEPFGREGAMRLLFELEMLVDRALEAGMKLVAIGD
jgi:hypothetical protein